MALHIGEDEFGLSPSDEEDIIALMDDPCQGVKRKASFIEDSTRTKKAAIESARTFPSAVTALTRDFGLKAFRLKQEQVISRVLNGGSAVVVFPTGGGKSLCYQIPALVFSDVDALEGIRGEGNSGVTLVVSPLIALMKDQVDSLVRRGIRAATLDSTKSREEYFRTCEMLRNGELKLLYCAPERLNNEGFVELMKYVRGGIRLLAVDEAHCISEWGHAFRPDYLKVSRFVDEINAERVICLTATATPRVATDIRKAFNIDEAHGLFRTSSYRSNLRLLAKSGETKKELYPKLYKFLEENRGASIVYVTLQKQTEELAAELRRKGFKAGAFHAGMDTVAKIQLQEEFMQCEDLIIVATIAFGMGIDKASIRNVVHFNIPSSLESYSQEIGRAGRDGKISNCVFYVCGEDLHLREKFARGDLPSRESLRGLLKEIFDPATTRLPVGAEFKVSHSAQEKEFDIRSTTLKNIYAQLELTHGLLRATTPIYSKYTYIASGQYKPKLASDQSPAAGAVKLHARQAKTLYHIDAEAASTYSGVLRADIVRKLNELNDTQVIELKAAGVFNVYKILQSLPKTSAEIENIVTALYSTLKEREQQALNRTDEMLKLITSKACFSRSLAQHFGDDLPNGVKECGHCTWCLTHEAVVQKIPPMVKFNWPVFNAILKEILVRDDARFLARIAFGITSPRAISMKLSKNPVFGSMEDHSFMSLLRAFTTQCSRTNQGSIGRRKLHFSGLTNDEAISLQSVNMTGTPLTSEPEQLEANISIAELGGASNTFEGGNASRVITNSIISFNGTSVANSSWDT